MAKELDRDVCVRVCKTVYHGMKTWSRTRVNVKTWNGAEVWAERGREWKNDGTSELEVSLKSKNQ